MKSRVAAICFSLALVMFIIIAGCGKDEPEFDDIESVRAYLKEQVASGELTKEEAIVRLAEATAEFGSCEKSKAKVSPELEAFGKKLKEQIENGEITEDEAGAAWMEAAKEAKGKSGGK